MMKYDDLYFASRYNFYTDCVEWYFLPKTEIKVFLKKMDIRGFGWRPSICGLNRTMLHIKYLFNASYALKCKLRFNCDIADRHRKISFVFFYQKNSNFYLLLHQSEKYATRNTSKTKTNIINILRQPIIPFAWQKMIQHKYLPCVFTRVTISSPV